MQVALVSECICGATRSLASQLPSLPSACPTEFTNIASIGRRRHHPNTTGGVLCTHCLQTVDEKAARPRQSFFAPRSRRTLCNARKADSAPTSMHLPRSIASKRHYNRNTATTYRLRCATSSCNNRCVLPFVDCRRVRRSSSLIHHFLFYSFNV